MSANSPYKTVRDLVDVARKHRGKLNYGSAGVGLSQHMAAAMFKKLVGIDDFRSQLNLRDIEELPFERGVVVSYETIRRWCDKFGASFAHCAKSARR